MPEETQQINNLLSFSELDRERVSAIARGNIMNRPTGDLTSYDDIANAWMLDTPPGSLITKFTTLFDNDAFLSTYKYIGDASPYAAMRRDFFEPEPPATYNVYRDEDLTGYENYYEDFLGVNTPDEARAMKQLIDINTQRRMELDQNGAMWTRLLANVLDPINLVPVPLARGVGFVKGFKRGAVGVGGVLAPGELMRLGIDPTTTLTETVMNISGGVLFGGALGGLVGKISARTVDDAANRWFDGNDAVDAANRISDNDPHALAGIRPMEEPTIVVVRDVDGGVPAERVSDMLEMKLRSAFYRDVDEAGERVNTIFIDDFALRQAFENKAWTNPKVEGVAPLPADRFKTFEEWREFVIRHETAHAYFRRHTDETHGAYEQRINRIADDVDEFNDYLSVARSYNPDRLVPTGLAENLRWEQHPFFLLLNNKFTGFVGNEYAAVANEFAGAAGLMNKGNQAETATRQSIYIQAKQHNPLLVEARACFWKSYKERQGLDPQQIIARPGAQAVDSLKELVTGGAKRYNEFTNLVTKHYLEGTKPPNKAVSNAVEAMRKYYDEMGKRAKEVGAFNTTRMEKSLEFKNEAIAKAEEALESMEATLASIQKTERMTTKQFNAREKLANEAIPQRRARLENLRNQRDGLDAALKDPESLPMLDPSASGHFHRIWKRGVVEEHRGVLEGILAKHFEAGAGKMERVRDTVDNILKVGKLGRVARALTEAMDQAGAPVEAMTRATKEIEKISKRRRDGKPLTTEEKMADADIIVKKYVEMYGLGNGTAKYVNQVMDEIMELSSHPGAEVFGSAPGLLSRRLNLPTHLFANVPELKGGSFIETDPETVMRIYHRRMSVAIEGARRYGDPSMQARIDELYDIAEREIQAALKEGNIEKAAALEGERKIQIQAATDIRDKILGVYGIPNDPSALGVRAIQFAKNWMVMALMGKATVAALADMGRMAMAVGSKEMFESASAKWTTASADFAKGGREVELAGEAAEVALHGRFEAIMDLEQYYTGVSTIEKYAEKGTNAMFLLNALAPYTDVMKRFSGAIIQSQMIESMLIWTGKKSGTITKRQRETLLRLGIDKEMAKSISRQWEVSGALGPGRGTNKLFLANTEEWTDVEAQRIFRNALAEEVNNAVITPGPADKLNFMSTPMGSLITQFKSFGMAATNRTMLAGLQQRDSQALHGIIAMVGLGYLVDAIRSGPFDDRPILSLDRFVQAVDYSGVFGILFELNNMMEMTSGAVLDQNIGIRPLLGIDPKFGDATAARAIGQTGGPSLGLFANLISAYTSDDAEASDQIRAVRRLIPFNQLIWWSWAVSRIQRDAISIAED